MLQVSKCLIGLAVMVLQSCDVADNRRDLLCGNWESVEGKPDVLIYKEGEAYKVTVFKRSGLRRKLKPETYLLQEENGNLFMNTGFRIDVSYNEATDILTFSPNGDYVRVNPKPDHPIGNFYFIPLYNWSTCLIGGRYKLQLPIPQFTIKIIGTESLSSMRLT